MHEAGAAESRWLVAGVGRLMDTTRTRRGGSGAHGPSRLGHRLSGHEFALKDSKLVIQVYREGVGKTRRRRLSSARSLLSFRCTRPCSLQQMPEPDDSLGEEDSGSGYKRSSGCGAEPALRRVRRSRAPENRTIRPAVACRVKRGRTRCPMSETSVPRHPSLSRLSRLVAELQPSFLRGCS